MSVTPNESYSIAFKYLYSKYGVRGGYNSTFSEKLRKCRNVKERKALENNTSDNDYQLMLRDVPNDYSDDHCIHLLLQQFYFGVGVKFELHSKLIQMGIIEQ